MSNIGAKVYELRQRYQLTQTQLAKAIGTDRSWISKLENGVHTSITTRNVEKLAAVLKTTPSELLR